MSATLSRWSRAFVAAGVCWLVAWQVAVLLDGPRRTAVALGLFGFVLHVVFGKAYSLVPSYFDRNLAAPRAPAVHLPLALVGTALLAAGPVVDLSADAAGPVAGHLAGADAVGGVLWAAGVAVFLVTMLATLRDNLSGAETGTGDHDAHRRPVDRAANPFVPVVFAYLALGSYETLATTAGVPTLFGTYPPRATHLLAAGTAALLVFAIGFRLLPRFLVAPVPRWLPWVVLPAGAVGPALLAAGLPSGLLFRAGAALEAVAVAGFAGAYWLLWARSDRDRVGFYGPLAGVAAGVAGVALGLRFAFGSPIHSLFVVHYRLNLLGFLGLTVVGVTYQFYPPAVGRFPGAGDRLATATMAGFALALLAEAAGAFGMVPELVVAGHALALAAAVAYAYLILGVFLQRARS